MPRFFLIFLFFTAAFAEAKKSACAVLATEEAKSASEILLSRFENSKDLGREIEAYTLSYSEQKVKLFYQTKEKDFLEIQKGIEESRRCGDDLKCLLGYAKKTVAYADVLLKASVEVLRAEAEVKEMLFEMTSERPSLRERIRQYYSKKFFTFAQVIEKFSQLKQSFKFRNIRDSDAVRRDWMKATGTVLFYQGVVQVHPLIQKMRDNVPIDLIKDTQWYIFLNTIFMMSVQAEVGALNTPEAKGFDPVAFTTYKGFILQLPKLLHGEKGFWRETKERIGGYAAVVPLDVGVITLLKVMKFAAAGGALTLGNVAYQASSGALGMSLFLGYLAVRWSFIDKIVNNRGLPLLRQGIETKTNQRWEQFRAKHNLPEHLKLNDYLKFYKQDRELNSLELLPAFVTHRDQIRKSFLDPEILALKQARMHKYSLEAMTFAWYGGLSLFDAWIMTDLLDNVLEYGQHIKPIITDLLK